MSETTNREHEGQLPIEVSVAREPDESYGFMIAIRNTTTKQEARAYNRAVEEVLRGAGLEPRQSLSRPEIDEPGLNV